MRKFKASRAGAGQRADIFVAAKYPEFSRSALESLFDDGLVQINNKLAKPSQRVLSGDNFAVDDTMLKAEPPKIDLPVIFMDDSVIVIDKPAGVLTHSKGALNDEATVASFISGKLTDKALSGNRAGIVHRLDRPTSGVIITARNRDSQTHLQKQFAKRKAKKTYLAVVEGWPEPPEAVIDAPIERNPRKPQTFRVGSGGKPAQTQYKTLGRIEKNGKKYSLLELKPTTGRTHQLRIHLAYINHPIEGDWLYGHGDNLLLHASELEITLPGGERKIFESPTPVRVKEFMD